MTPSLIRSLQQLHRWLGLAAGLPFLLVALSGAALVFRAQLEPVVSARLLVAPTCHTPLPLDRLVDAARAAHPDGGALSRIRLSGDPSRSARVRFSDDRWVHVDRCNGQVLGAQALYSGPVGTISWLHILGFTEFTGSSDSVLKVAGVAFAVLVAAGTALWRPRRSAGPRSRRGMHWHRTLGVAAALILLTSILSGILQAFSWGAAGPAAPLLPARTQLALTRPTLAQLLDQAQALAPQASRIQIRLPARPSDVLTFEMVGHAAVHANAIDYAMFDPVTGALLRHVPYASTTAAHKLYLLAAGVHYGWVGGLAAQLLLFTAALSVCVLAWTGTASYLRTCRRERTARRESARLRLRVARKTVEATGICSFELVAPRGRRLPRFEAGAHIDVHITPKLVRQYSLCNHPRDRHRYLICVLHVPDSRGGSRAMHDEVEAGDLIEVGFPRNHFPLHPSARRSLLFAGGIGITPILSMAEQLAGIGADFELHYYARSRERAAFVARLAESSFADRVHLHLSEGPPGAQAELPVLLARPERGAHVYVCGPTGFMNAVLDAARAAGWEESQLHREVFVGATAQPSDKPFDLHLVRSARIIPVAGGQSALDALLSAGLHIPFACRQGVCGSCVIGVLDGEPEHRDHCLSLKERERNDVFTPCCSRARGAYLALDL